MNMDKITEFDSRVERSISIIVAPKDMFELKNRNFKFKQGRSIYALYELVKSHIKITELIDFKCDFDESGLCSERRTDDSSNNKMCCCIGCYDSIGYLGRGLPLLVENLPIYRKSFRKNIGFWRPETGCSLPRELRSPVCAFYKCWKLNEDDKDMNILRTARDVCTFAANEIRRLIEESNENKT